MTGETAPVPHRPSVAHWFRWSDYEVVGGTHIAPTLDAEPSWYDPFTAHEERWEGPERGADAPYAELANIDVRRDRESVLAWCRRYGLLGILPHRTLQARFWPVWGKSAPRREGTRSVGRDPGILRAEQTRYRQGHEDSTVVLDHVTRSAFSGDEGPLRKADFDTALRSRTDVSQSIERPGVQVRRSRDGVIDARDFMQGWAQFFPRRRDVSRWTIGHAERHYPESTVDGGSGGPTPAEARAIETRLQRELFPTPYSPEFCRQYGEPLHLFALYADHVRDHLAFWADAADAAASAEAPGPPAAPSGPESPGDGRPAGQSRGAEARALPSSFRAALEPVSPVARPLPGGDGARWQDRWSVPSLYAALAVMMLQDVPLGGAVVRTCKNENCRRRFPTRNGRKEFCGTRCRDARYMRRYRAGTTGTTP